jgi:hypothetical protein
VCRIVEEAPEAEVAQAVGRGYYENGAAPGAGYRNGYRRGRLSTAEAAIELPQVADRPEPLGAIREELTPNVAAKRTAAVRKIRVDR